VLDVEDPAKVTWLAGAWNIPAEDLALMGNYALVAGGDKGLVVYQVQQHLYPPLKAPVFSNGMMTLTWATTNDVRLQKATNLVNAIWLDVPESEGTNILILPITEGNAFFRLVKGIEVPSGALAAAVNPANGHRYYLLPESTWTEAEEMAESLGGTLAIINDETENQWVFETFSQYGGVERGLWIGLTDQAIEGQFCWVDGTPLSFQRWADGEPNDNENAEDWVHVFYPLDTAGRAPGWNDSPNVAGHDASGSGQGWIPFNGVVEVVR
jgi:hypothetical protein